MKHIVNRMSSYFPNRWPLSYLNLTKNMKTYIRRQQHKKKLNTKTYNKKKHHRSIDLERSAGFKHTITQSAHITLKYFERKKLGKECEILNAEAYAYQ